MLIHTTTLLQNVDTHNNTLTKCWYTQGRLDKMLIHTTTPLQNVDSHNDAFTKCWYTQRRLYKMLIHTTRHLQNVDAHNETFTKCCYTHGGIITGVAQGGEFNLLRWWGSVVYITSSRRTVRLGSLQGIYERDSWLKSKSGRQQPHRWDCTLYSVQPWAPLVYLFHGYTQLRLYKMLIHTTTP